MKKLPSIPESKSVSPADLEFDFQNPRLVDGDEPVPANEKAMVGWMWRHADVSELLVSISQSGWMPFDDMVVLATVKNIRFWKGIVGSQR